MSRTVLRQILQDHGESVALPDHQERILRLLAQCRTSAAGVHILHCLSCGHEQVRCNSCRNRHCPLCQGAEQAAWVREREEELLPVPYLHGVCTLPHEFLPLAERAPAVVYDLLLRCARQSLADLCADPRHLGAQVGIVSVLHTWGSDLKHHPHVHLIITGGGLTSNGEWQAAKVSKKKRKLFLIPIACWRARFRGLMLRGLRNAYAVGAFNDADGASPPSWPDTASFHRFLAEVGRKPWVIYLKEPFGGPRQVVRYLGRYTHRVALNPQRIVHYDGAEVHLIYTDYTSQGAQRVRRFTGPEFIQAFARHILPAGFRRIRMAGLWGPRLRKQNLQRARDAIAAQLPPQRSQRLPNDPQPLPAASKPLCKVCGTIGEMVVRIAQRWNRRLARWISDAPDTTQRLIHHKRLRCPVPQPPPGENDPENLFFLP